MKNMKYKPLINYDTYDTDTKISADGETTTPSTDLDVPRDEYGNPLIVPAEELTNSVLNFEHLLKRKTRQYLRVPCKGLVILSNRQGKIVAKGALRDLNEKSSGFEIKGLHLKVNDVFYLEFKGLSDLAMTRVKVILKRIYPTGKRSKIGVEFIETSPAFQKNLARLLAEARAKMDGFRETEII